MLYLTHWDQNTHNVSLCQCVVFNTLRSEHNGHHLEDNVQWFMFVSPIIWPWWIDIFSTSHTDSRGCRNTRWRPQMETFSALLALCVGNSPATGEFPSQRPVTRRFNVCFLSSAPEYTVNNREAGDLRRHRAHYDVIVMTCSPTALSSHKTRGHVTLVVIDGTTTLGPYL